MSKFKFITTFIICILLISCTENLKLVYIEKENFNSDWTFKLLDESQSENSYFQQEKDTNGWEKVQLPHTPRIEPKIVNDQWQGICWYRKNFTLSNEMRGKQLFLKFEGAMNIAEVWVNGVKKITHQGGYLPFVVDFTDVADFKKENTITVRLDNKDNPITGPKQLKYLDFNTYGGLYRNVWLIAKNQLHITDPILEQKTASGGVFITYPQVSEENATVQVKTHIKNSGAKGVSFFVRNTLLQNDSVILSVNSENKFLEKKQDIEILANLSVNNPKLWSPINPNLYSLKTEVISNGQIVDQELTRIGIKTMKFVGQDFYLNGKKTFLRGVNRHQEYPFVGYALSDNANYRDAKKIKDAGFDYVRLSHYPQSTSFMNACDELGLITINAILGWQYFNEDERFQKHVFQTARDLIRRDRNHASILAWEVSLNESWMPESFIDSLIHIAHQEYPGNQCFTAGWQYYGYDIFLQARQARSGPYDEKLKKPYNVSEYGDWEYYAGNAGLNQDSWSDLLPNDRSSRQLRSAGEKALLQQATNIQEAHNDNFNTPMFADGYWVMFDYNRGYADDLEASGIMDIFRLPKPSYYFFKSQRDINDPNGEPMVHIASNWDEESALNVRVFSNCDNVELVLNGKSLGLQKPDINRISNNLKHPPFTFQIPKFELGTLEAKGFVNNKLVVNHIVRTPQKATNIEVALDLSGYALKSNDIVFVHALLKDSNGEIVNNFKDEILFSLEGDAIIIGENPVYAEAGIASILVKTGKDLNNLKIEAKTVNNKLIGSYTIAE